MLCVGVYFGVDSLQEELPYGSVEQQELPRVLFRASLDWLEKTDFIEKPDIRTIQVYCVMTTCLHALGSVYISKQLLNVVVGMAGVLRLDNIEDDEGQPLNFQKEIAKRLWYSFFIVDSVSNVPRRLIGEFSTPFPRLVSTNELLGRSEDRELGYSNQYGSRSDDISGLLYERLMAQMSQIKQDSYKDKLTGLTDAWCRMNKLKDQLDKYFGSSPYSITDNRIGQFAKYLLFSSLARECLGLSARLLTQTGKDFWQRNFRSDCLKLALELVAHNSLKDTPPYYKRYWIVGQHLIYACLFVLLDMLMFSQKNCEENLSRIKNAIPTVRSLRSTHYTVRMGLAVIEKLYYLVSSVRLRGSVGAAGSAGTVEDFSLREFLRDLQVATIDNNTAQIPSPTESQYLRRGKRGELGNLEEKKVNEVQIANSPIAPSQSFLDPELDGLLDETGWKEFLGFFFGGQNEMGDTRQ
ncbi:DEKNAAC100921 [Brettanomyces naardenensis]|uniref:DEKNAAC100921 n=1 Tax=Brettanomyces naardenensis TaxID=13370 RepID=A0A448YGW4_BRENA|nr:DEKNAAC100921 [Brettanomyces naardenensis]